MSRMKLRQFLLELPSSGIASQAGIQYSRLSPGRREGQGEGEILGGRTSRWSIGGPNEKGRLPDLGDGLFALLFQPHPEPTVGSRCRFPR